jgi:hypothetical protein
MCPYFRAIPPTSSYRYYWSWSDPLSLREINEILKKVKVQILRLNALCRMIPKKFSVRLYKLGKRTKISRHLIRFLKLEDLKEEMFGS